MHPVNEESDPKLSPTDSAAADTTASTATQAPPKRRRPSVEPIPAPLPARRSDDRPGVWLEPETRTEPGFPLGDMDKLPPLPRSLAPRRYGTLLSFLLMVVLPTLLLGAYYAFVADDEYFAEFRFSVTQGTPVLPGTPSSAMTGASSGSGLAAFLGGSGTSGAASQNFIVADYLTSPQAVDDLQKRIDVRSLYSRSEINRWQRFDSRKPMEAFVDYFSHYVHADYDQVTGLAIATVRAFTAADAQRIGQTLADLSEALVNEINSRAYRDSIRAAEVEVQQAQQHMKEVDASLLAFRAKEGVIDPGNSVVATNIQLAQQLEGNLVNLQAQLGAQGLANMDTRNGPAGKLLRAQIESNQQQLAVVERQIAHDSGGAGGANALADVVGKYEQLTLDQQYAQTMLMQTLQALDLARANAVAQHLYIVPYVTPILPQSATYPHRGLNTLLGSLGFFGFWLAALLVYRTIQDHAI